MNDTNVTVRIGDIFTSDAQTLVNTVNTEGVMGKGIALQFKKRFPDMYADYVERCERHEVVLGRPYIFKDRLYPWIVNFPTKKHWRSISRVSDIEEGMAYLAEHYREWGVVSLAVPPLGCGEGGLEWRVVGRILYRFLSEFDIPVDLYAPHGTPHEQLGEVFLESPIEDAFNRGPVRLPPAWVAVVEILRRIEREPYHWPVGRTMFQKIAYFATEQGLPTNLEFTKQSFGPFTPGLRRLQASLMANGLLTERRAPHGNMYAVQVGPKYELAVDAYRDELGQWNGEIDRIADLFLRFNATQAEIAATVHYAASRLVGSDVSRPSESDVLDAVIAWKRGRRPPLKDQDVAKMIRNLNLLGWLDLTHSADLPLPEHTYVDEFELQEA